MLTIGVLGLFLGLAAAISTSRSFPPTRRFAMELMPSVAIEYLKNNISELAEDDVFMPYYDSFLLQSRYSVERILTIEER